MAMYNLVEYNYNYEDIYGGLWQFKRDEQNMNNGNPANVTTNDSTSFKYKSNFLGNPTADGALKNVKIAIPIKYLSNFQRSLEMPLINCKIHLELNWTKNCLMSENNT